MSETERNAASLTRTIVVVVVSLCLAEESLSQQRPRQSQVSYGSQGSYVLAMSYEPFGPKEPFGPTEPPFGQPKQTAYGESQRLAPIRYEPFRPVPARQPSDYPRHPTEVRVLHLDEGEFVVNFSYFFCLIIVKTYLQSVPLACFVKVITEKYRDTEHNPVMRNS